ncbi:hypothetical protein BDV96DRAFT_649882 [Lophiotrema nucula]|uniref:Uncharacterized protein n=1 Tax=Lophiotrema nucula TaxID=690887 RepID=A0A6A5YYL6_9PLEO|nr:hypothetical protein BDV96DRAFT_649882 [Lophiotrema nucula]
MPVTRETVEQLKTVLAQLESELDSEESVPQVNQTSSEQAIAQPSSIKSSIKAIRSVLGDTEAIVALKSRPDRKPAKKFSRSTDPTQADDAAAKDIRTNVPSKRSKAKTPTSEPPTVFHSLNTFRRLADPDRDEQDDFEPTWKELADMVEIDIQVAATKRRKQDFAELLSLKLMLAGVATLHRTTLDHVENHVMLYHRQDDSFMAGLKKILKRGQKVSQEVIDKVGNGLDE